MADSATESDRAPVIQPLQTLRGVAEVSATSLVADVEEFRRFRNPAKRMAYEGLVPEEYSSGSSRKQVARNAEMPICAAYWER